VEHYFVGVTRVGGEGGGRGQMPFQYFSYIKIVLLVPVTARSKAYVCGRSPAGIVVRIPPGAWTFVVSVVCFQVEVSATG
jgi:hypothetical protein